RAPFIASFVLIAASSLSGCLAPTARVEEARSALRVEQRAHRETAGKVYELTKRLDKAERELAERGKKVEKEGDAVAQATFDYDVALKQRDEAEAMVEQLRGELARVGNHLKAYAGERERLAQELEQKQLEAHKLAQVEQASQAQVLLMRDLTLEFHQEITKGNVKLTSERGVALLQFPASETYAEDGSLSATGRQRLTRIAKRTRGADGVSFKLEIAERGSDAAADSTLLRLSQVAEALAGVGVDSESITVSVDGEDEAGKKPAAKTQRLLVVGISPVAKAGQVE
ncbi:MAG: hypothetical protein KC766_02155, partial [Myxococcales bacterium]|nr:hypothetical protein [Myxococcales bacterium]